MQIPEHLRHFPEPTLIVISDTQNAKFFLAGGDALEPVDAIALPPELESDSEGSFTNFNGSHLGSGQNDISDEPRKKRFTKLIAERIASFIDGGKATKTRIAAPPEILRRIEEELRNDLASRILSKLGKDVMKESPIDVLKRFF